jgi:hypothetical protein
MNPALIARTSAGLSLLLVLLLPAPARPDEVPSFSRKEDVI